MQSGYPEQYLEQMQISSSFHAEKKKLITIPSHIQDFVFKGEKYIKLINKLFCVFHPAAVSGSVSACWPVLSLFTGKNEREWWAGSAYCNDFSEVAFISSFVEIFSNNCIIIEEMMIMGLALPLLN